MIRYVTGAQAEARAEERIAEYEQQVGPLEAPPVPIESLIDFVYDLKILWEPIATYAGLSPAAALRPRERQIVINEAHRRRFDAHPEQLQFAYAHELGHWDLYVDQAALTHPVLGAGLAIGAFQRHRTPTSDVAVLLGRLHEHGYSREELYAAHQEAMRDLDDFFEARQVNRYAGALLMPERLLRHRCQGRNLLRWPTLYDLSREFAVSISAMKIRLETLSLIYVARDKTIHRSREEHLGQGRLF